MISSSDSAWKRWWFALKPAAWPKLLIPCVLGQSLGLLQRAPMRWGAHVVGVLFTLSLGVAILLLNDVADVDVDRLKRRMYPQSVSAKSIPDGIVKVQHVLAVGASAALTALLLSVIAALVWNAWWLGWMGLVSVGLFAAYSLPPLRMNYRGGGELLEALGVGVMLPWFNAAMVAGVLLPRGVVFLPGFACLAFASAIASGLSDERSDRRGGKKTWVVLWGNRAARVVSELAVMSGAALWLVAAALRTDLMRVREVLLAAVVVVLHRRGMVHESSQALTDAFPAQGRYKKWLHLAVIRGALVMCVLCLLHRVMR